MKSYKRTSRFRVLGLLQLYWHETKEEKFNYCNNHWPSKELLIFKFLSFDQN